MSEQIYENQQRLARDTEFDVKHIAWASKQSLKVMAESLMSHDTVKKMPLEYRARLRAKLDDLLRQKEIDEKKLKEEWEILRANLAKEVAEKSVTQWKRLDWLQKTKNVFSKALTRAEILADEKIFQEKSILDYDNKKWNYKKSVKEFESELKEKNIEQINARWLVSYLEYLKESRWNINSFVNKLWWDKVFSLTLLFTATLSNNNKSLLKKQLIEEWHSDLVWELNLLLLKELKKDSNYKKFFETIFNEEKWYLKWVNEHSITLFAIKMQNCRGINELTENLKLLKIEERSVKDVQLVYNEIYKDALENKTQIELRKQENEKKWGLKISEKFTIIHLIWEKLASLIPSRLRQKKIKQFEKQDWIDIERAWITSQLPQSTKDSLDILKLETQNNKDIAVSWQISSSNTSACNLQNACRIEDPSKRGRTIEVLFKSEEYNFYNKQRIINKIELINKFTWFENIKDVNQLLDDKIKLNTLVDLLSKKKDKTKEEQELLNDLKAYHITQDTSTNYVNKELKKDINQKIESQIQDEFLSVIQKIFWNDKITHAWDIMYDKYALDWAISYLTGLKNKTRQEKEVLEKLKLFRKNLWDIKKAETALIKNNGQFSADEKKNNTVSQQYIANNNNFDLWYIVSQDGYHRKEFFDAFFNYIDTHWDVSKKLKNSNWVEFSISKDWEWTYVVNYWDREIKNLKRKEVRDSLSFANFLSPLWLKDLIPFSSRIIEEINKKSNWEPINDLDWLSDKEKNLILQKLWTAIIPGYTQKPEVEENNKQFEDMSKLNANIKWQKDFQYNWTITSLGQLLKLRFPTDNQDSFDIKSLLKAIPN